MPRVVAVLLFREGRIFIPTPNFQYIFILQVFKGHPVRNRVPGIDRGQKSEEANLRNWQAVLCRKTGAVTVIINKYINSGSDC